MANYTTEDFTKAMSDAGLTRENFSDADWALAEKNPTFGMSAVAFKNDYNKAQTEEARAAANAGMNQLRSAYGGYTGGSDGMGYTPSAAPEPSTVSFRIKTASEPKELPSGGKLYPTYRSADQGGGYTEQSHPDDGMSDETKLARTAMINAYTKPFSYDYNSDPLYSSYRKQYLREGSRATQDAIGQYAAATGGVPSSYAVGAATQAGDYYASKVADAIPQLEGVAYGRYVDDINRKAQLYGTLSAEDQARTQTQEQREARLFDMATTVANLYGNTPEYWANILKVGAGEPTWNAKTDAETLRQGQQRIDLDSDAQLYDVAMSIAQLYGGTPEYWAGVLKVGVGDQTWQAQVDTANLKQNAEKIALERQETLLNAGVKIADMYGSTPEYWANILGVGAGEKTWQVIESERSAAADEIEIYNEMQSEKFSGAVDLLRSVVDDYGNVPYMYQPLLNYVLGVVTGTETFYKSGYGALDGGNGGGYGALDGGNGGGYGAGQATGVGYGSGQAPGVGYGAGQAPGVGYDGVAALAESSGVTTIHAPSERSYIPDGVDAYGKSIRFVDGNWTVDAADERKTDEPTEDKTGSTKKTGSTNESGSSASTKKTGSTNESGSSASTKKTGSTNGNPSFGIISVPTYKEVVAVVNNSDKTIDEKVRQVVSYAETFGLSDDVVNRLVLDTIGEKAAVDNGFIDAKVLGDERFVAPATIANSTKPINKIETRGRR